VLEIIAGTTAGGLAEGSLWAWIAGVNFLHFAILLFGVCTLVLVVVSLMTDPPSKEQLAGLTFATTPKVLLEKAGADWRRRDLILTVVLIIVVAVVWIYFS
jgi:SSS family solute:Na+ symporter